MREATNPSAKVPPSGSGDAPPSPGRRSLLLGFGLAGGALGLGKVASAADATHTAEDDGALDTQPFFGPHQAGVVTAQPAAALYASFDVLAESREDVDRLFRLLTERIAYLMRGGPAEVADPRFPPPDSGLLGPDVIPDNLTVTVAAGASLFDDRFGLTAARPTYLEPMPRFPNDALDASLCHGDLLLQFCSHTAETSIHALRDVIKHTPDLLALRWKIEGFLPPRTVKKLGRDTVRNLLGFKDGTANLDSRDEALMRRIVWVDEANREPAWARGGSYQVVRIVRTLVERWDRTPLGEQQSIIGRDKMSGAPLGMTHERDPVDYASDPEGHRIPLDAHIRRANPRTPQTDTSLILRRSYNFSRGLTNAGQLDMGLLFVCFQSDLRQGFATVQARLNGEQLEEYVKPVGGGYFFVLPGVPAPGRYLGSDLIKATA